MATRQISTVIQALDAIRRGAIPASDVNLDLCIATLSGALEDAQALEQLRAEPTVPALTPGFQVLAADVVARAHLYLRGGQRAQPEDVLAFAALVVAHQGCAGRQVARG